MRGHQCQTKGIGTLEEKRIEMKLNCYDKLRTGKKCTLHEKEVDSRGCIALAFGGFHGEVNLGRNENVFRIWLCMKDFFENTEM